MMCPNEAALRYPPRIDNEYVSRRHSLYRQSLHILVVVVCDIKADVFPGGDVTQREGTSTSRRSGRLAWRPATNVFL